MSITERAVHSSIGSEWAEHTSDLEAYPIVFLYRHAIELLLKGILTIGDDLAGLLDDESIRTANPYQDHSLARHLPKIRAIFEAVGWKHAFETAGMSSDQFGQSFVN
jgi:hypothetical protein